MNRHPEDPVPLHGATDDESVVESNGLPLSRVPERGSRGEGRLGDAGVAAEIAPGLWRLSMPIPGHTLGGVCAFLVRDHDGYAMIDCGMDVPSCVEALEAQLEGLGAPVSALHTIIATHCHPDHLGQAARLRARSDARVWLHALDAPLVHPVQPTGDADLEALVDWLARHGFRPAEAAEARDSVDTGQGETYLLEPDRLLEGGETFTIGSFHFEVVWTPGHTPGHVCLFEPTRRLLLTGDHLFARAAPNVRLMSYSPIDTMGRYIASLERVAQLQADLALPAHGPPFAQVAERAGEVIHHQQGRRERLRGMLTDRPQTAYELAQLVWGPGARTTWASFHARLRRNAALTLAAHLEQLALDGQVARHEDGGVVGFASLH